MRNQSFERKINEPKKREEMGEKGTISAGKIWNIRNLEDIAWKAVLNFKKNNDEGYFRDRQGYRSSMIAPISPGSYYQTREIAETLGLEYDELIMNEDELDSLREKMRLLSGELLRDLHSRIHLPPGFSFGMGHDPEGNFGLILQEKTEETIYSLSRRWPPHPVKVNRPPSGPLATGKDYL